MNITTRELEGRDWRTYSERKPPPPMHEPVRTKSCQRCKIRTFTSRARNRKYCDQCQDEVARESAARQNQKRRG